jgi:hypothetical protein
MRSLIESEIKSHQCSSLTNQPKNAQKDNFSLEHDKKKHEARKVLTYLFEQVEPNQQEKIELKLQSLNQQIEHE